MRFPAGIFLNIVLIITVSSLQFPGNPVYLSWITKTNTNEIDLDALDRLFLHPEVQHRKISIVSILGPSKLGKSVLLDYCLRYLYANVSIMLNQRCTKIV